MPFPRLTFFCELEAEALSNLLTETDLADLADLKAEVSLGILDLSPERAEFVRRLAAAGISVTAWLLLPKDQGYWFNLDNVPQAVMRYRDFQAWAKRNSLHFQRVGLDIEPSIHEMRLLSGNRWDLLQKAVRRSLDHKHYNQARDAYLELIGEIHRDGYLVDTYQFPFIVDERMVRSTFLQRLAGVVDLPTDREVLMLYTSLLRPHGPGFLWSYAPLAQSVGVGVTGGGVDLEVANRSPLTWDELARDLRLVWVRCDDIHIFSLEGCLQQGFLKRLKGFQWDWPILDPGPQAERVDRGRQTLRSLLWLGANPLPVTIGLGALVLLTIKVLRKLA